VKAGDSLSAIASSLGVTTAALAAANNLSDPNSILLGQQLKVPPPSASTPAAAATSSSSTAGSAASSSGGAQSYTVKPGDTACQIALNNKVSLTDLAAANGIGASGLDTITVGQVLKIPSASTSGAGC